MPDGDDTPTEPPEGDACAACGEHAITHPAAGLCCDCATAVAALAFRASAPDCP